MPTQRSRARTLAIALSAVIAVYLLLTAGLYLAMLQPPERFGAIMAHVPRPLFLVLPFRNLWLSAREGNLKPGDPAPDFELPVLAGQSRVRLSQEWHRRPVVLVFGSYT